MTAPPTAELIAPAANGSALIVPPAGLASDLLVASRQLTAKLPDELRALQSIARTDLVRLATTYTSQYTNVAAVSNSPSIPNIHNDVASGIASFGPIILTGHQPELFHPGVWFKNFLADQLGKQHNALSIHLIIDNDTFAEPAIHVPTGSLRDPARIAVPFDESSPELPFEERRVLNPNLLPKFAQRVADAFRPLAQSTSFSVDELLVHQWQKEALEARQRSEHWGIILSQARSRLEIALGLNNLELPLSQLCQQASFGAFLQWLLRDISRLHSTYNQALVDYRRTYRLRSRSHPAPDLESIDEWQEVPLWIWTKESPVRRRAFARQTGSEVQISDLEGSLCSFPLHGSWSPEDIWQQAGIKIRPRALITTLFARLFASDIFIHGLGGAKYDRVTDQLAERMWDLKLPQHITATATVHLPLAFSTVSEEESQHLQKALRDLSQHPERHLPAEHLLVLEKRALIAGGGTEFTPRDRALRLQVLNARMAEELVHQREALSARLAEWKSAQSAQRILASREYAYVLFPRTKLSTLLVDLAACTP